LFKKVVNVGRNFSNFDKVLIINLGLACSNNGDQDDHMVLFESKKAIAYPKHSASFALNYHTSSRCIYSDLEASTEHVAPWLLCYAGLRIEEGNYIAHFCILASGSMGAYIDR
jgi:hypothetical protein